MNTQRFEMLATMLEETDASQARGHLRADVDNRPCFCATGLACELYRQQTGVGEWKTTPIGTGWKFAGERSATNLLPPMEVREWFEDEGPRSLIGKILQWNDTTCLTFREIAARIREAIK
jgi:hypothetical protein